MNPLRIWQGWSQEIGRIVPGLGAWQRQALALFSLSFMQLAYQAGSLSDRTDPRSVLLGGIALLVAADLWLAAAGDLWSVAFGIVLWGAHMALTQGIFARMIADAAPDHERASSFGAYFFVSGIATLLASLGAGLIWDRDGAAMTFAAAAGVAALAGALLWLLPKRA